MTCWTRPDLAVDSVVCCEGLVWHRTFDNHAGRDYWYTNPGIGFCRTSWTQPRRKVTIPLSPLFRDNLDNSCLQWPVVLADSMLVRSHESGQVIDVQGASGSILGVHGGSFSCWGPPVVDAEVLTHHGTRGGRSQENEFPACPIRSSCLCACLAQ